MIKHISTYLQWFFYNSSSYTLGVDLTLHLYIRELSNEIFGRF